MVQNELKMFLESGRVAGEPTELNDEMIAFMMEMNSREDQKSFYFPDDEEETEELIEEGATAYAVYDGNGNLTACAIADPVEDNKTVEVSGPFGSTEDRIGLLRRIKLDFPRYDVFLFTSEKNELTKCFDVISNECYMDVQAEAYETEGVTEFDESEDSLELHDKIFPDAYTNAEGLPDEYDILVYKADNKVVGYIAYEQDEDYIDFVAVEPEFRRKGIARALVKAALNDMQGQTVHLTVANTNDEAIALYRSMGFVLRHYMLLLEVRFA